MAACLINRYNKIDSSKAFKMSGSDWTTRPEKKPFDPRTTLDVGTGQDILYVFETILIFQVQLKI